MKTRHVILVLSVAGLIALGATLAGKISLRLTKLDATAAEAAQRAAALPPKPAPQWVTPAAGPALETLTLTGTLKPDAEVDLAFKLPGRVAEVFVQRGDVVKAGAVLARLDGRDIEAQAAQARAGMKAAQAQKTLANDTWRRSKSLQEAGAASEQQVVMATGQHDLGAASIAQAEVAAYLVESARQETRLVSPIDGVVVRAPTAPGFFAAPGVPIYRVERLSTLKVHAHLSDADAARVSAGAKVTVQSDGGVVRTGTLERVIPSVDPMTHRVPIEAVMPNADGRLFAGALVEVTIDVPAPATLVVPKSALLTGEEAAVLVEDVVTGALRRVAVAVRSVSVLGVRVEAGLGAADRVLANPGSSWRHGDKLPATKR
ncbi:MAG: efflux RND transporter periplasmic adaptor subunit [Myxococcales bacterium]|nr:efflux RND transporter periplasmic adaptor subunit [Myxococcales bacterium]